MSRRFVNVCFVYAGGSTVYGRGVVDSGAGEAAGNEMVMGRVIGRSQLFSRTPLPVMHCSILKLGWPSQLLLYATFPAVNPPIKSSNTSKRSTNFSHEPH